MKQLGALLLGIILSGCATNDFAPVPKASQIDQLRSDSKGVILIYTSLNSTRCQTINAKLARPDAANHYTSIETRNLKYAGDGNVPGQWALPAGRYGIVGLECHSPRRQQNFYAKVTEKKGLWNRDNDVYDRPMATFDVQPGEIVDIGMLAVTGTGPGSFTTSVKPIPEHVLQNFATNEPELYEKIVTRPMTATASQK